MTKIRSSLDLPVRTALILAFMSSCHASSAAHADDRPTNLIVIFCDNLGYGDTEPFGATHHRTPHLNRMAREGRRFTHFYASAGVCTPSRASLLTGCYAQRVGMHTNPRDGQVLRPISPYGLNPEEITIAEILKPAGYATAIIGKWHLGDQAEYLPRNQGFDFFFGIPYSDDMTAAVGRRIAARGGDRFDGQHWPPLPLVKNDQVVEAPVNRDGLTKRYTEQAIRFLRRNRDHSFFLYLPHAMPGSTQSPFASEAFRRRSSNGPWGDAIEELDWSTGQILEELVRLDLSERTLVVWTSDNGAPLAKTDEDLSRGSNRPLHGRGYKTSEGGFRVPMIAWWPNHIPANTTCPELATTMDLLPTIAKLAGADLPKGRTIDGHDITGLLLSREGETTPYAAFYYYSQDQLQAVRSGQWKLFMPLETFSQHPHFRKDQSIEPLLFDLVEDLACERNLASQRPEVVARLTELARHARKDLGDRGQPGRGSREPGYNTNPVPLAIQRSR